jgi:integrase
LLAGFRESSEECRVDAPSNPRKIQQSLGAVAQLGERSVRNAEVRGSIPLGSIKRKIKAEQKLKCTCPRWAVQPKTQTCAESSAQRKGMVAMSRSPHIPSYRLHRQSGQAVVTLPDDLGRRRDVLLGKHGSRESNDEYARVIAEWQAKGRKIARATEITVNELMTMYWTWAEKYYGRREEMANIRISFRPLKFLYGTTLARELGPLALKAVRELMVTGYEHPQNGAQGSLARKNVNDRIGRIKRLVKWGVGEELLPPAVFQGLQAVDGLRWGKTQARESPPIKPVPQAYVDAVLPKVSAQVAAMIDLQLLTAMRPGEACIVRGCDLETSGRVWIYRPQRHKTEHHGHTREIYLGPQAQKIIKPFLRPDLQTFLFSPAEARAEHFRQLRANRQTKVQPSQVCRKKKQPKKLPGDFYTVASYRRAIARACEKAGVPSWHPHQLRHNAATNLRKQHGIELARIILGHSTAFTTEIYAEQDRAAAVEVIAKIG